MASLSRVTRETTQPDIGFDYLLYYISILFQIITLDQTEIITGFNPFFYFSSWFKSNQHKGSTRVYTRSTLESLKWHIPAETNLLISFQRMRHRHLAAARYLVEIRDMANEIEPKQRE